MSEQQNVVEEADLAWKRVVVHNHSISDLREAMSKRFEIPESMVGEVLGLLYRLGYSDGQRAQLRTQITNAMPKLVDENGQPVDAAGLQAAFKRVWGDDVFGPE